MPSNDKRIRPPDRATTRVSRRSLIAGAALSLTALTSCGLLAPPDPTPQPIAGNGGIAQPTPTPSRLFGVIPLPAAATPTPTPEPVVVRFGHWESGSARGILEGIVRDFNQSSPAIVVRTDILPFSAHFERVQRGFAAGDAPDVFVSSGAYFPRHATDLQLLDLSSRFASDGIRADDFWSEPITRSWQGKLLAVPLWASVDVMFVNRGSFDKVGIALPSDSWTWTNLLDIARGLTVGKPGETSHWGLFVVNDIQGGWGSLAAGNGGTWINLVTRRTTLDPATIDALRWLTDAMHVHHVAPNSFEQQRLTHGGTVDPFLAGDVSILANGTWAVEPALTGARFPWDVLRFPRAPRTGASTSLSSIQPGCIAGMTRHPDESWRFLASLLNQDFQSRWINGKVRIPSLKQACTDPRNGYDVAPPAGAVSIVSAIADSVDLHFTTNWQPFRAAVLGALEPVFAGQATLDSAVTGAIQAGDGALGP